MESAFKTCLLIICVVNGINGQERTHYMGAVVDFASNDDVSLTPFKRISANLAEYEKLIGDVSLNKADIVVFPECGLTSINLATSTDKLLPITSVIPDPLQGTYNPCEDIKSGDFSPQLRSLSCAAKKNNIYLVVNLPERLVNNSSDVDKTDLVYNTNVVFDRMGNVIARYRKFNLFVEPGFSSTPKAELIKFKTDFGVTFGTFICFDIMFKTPALDLLEKYEDVTDIVYPTAWFSELPFLTAVQTQAGWAKANGVNLLASGYNNPKNKNGGSGIYTADGNLKYIMPTKNETRFITYEIPIIKKRKVSVVTQHKPTPNNPIQKDTMVTLHENFSNYTTQLLNESITNYKLCHKEFCCNFDATFNKTKNPDYYYRLVVFEGARLFGVLWHDAQICGIAACSDETVESCGKRVANPINPIVFEAISVKGDKFVENSTFIPSYADYELGTINHYYYNATRNTENKFKTIEIKNLVPVTNLLGFGIYGTVTFSSASLFASELFVVLIVACFVVKFNY